MRTRSFLRKFLKIVIFFSVVACASNNSYNYKYKYTWKDSDTIEEIARKFNVDAFELRKINHVYEPEDLFVGKILLIPKDISQLVKSPEPPSIGVQKLRFRWPSPGQVSSKFGKRWKRYHYGIDIRSNAGKKIHSAETGIVKFAGAQRGFGKVIIVRHSKDYETLYAHNEKIYVVKGQKISQGTLISRMGRTGRVTGIHLHFEVHRKGKPVNPLKYLPRRNGLVGFRQ